MDLEAVERRKGTPLPPEERILAAAQATLAEIQEKGGKVVERDDLGCKDVLSSEGTRIFRVFSRGDTIVSLIDTSERSLEFPLMEILRPVDGDMGHTPQLVVPAYEERSGYYVGNFEVTYGRNGPGGNKNVRDLEYSDSTRYYFPYFINQGLVPSLESLPEDADILATAKVLFANVLRGDFSPPEVVRKPSAQIVYDRIEATLGRTDLPRPLGRLNILKPRSKVDEAARKILGTEELIHSSVPIIVCVGTDVNENEILEISGETLQIGMSWCPHLVFDLSAIAPDLSSSFRKIKMKIVRRLDDKIYLASESSDAGGGQIYLGGTAGQEQYPLIAIYKANGETMTKVLPLQLPEGVLKRAMEVIEPVAVAKAATPPTPGATVLSSGRIYPSWREGKKHPKATQQEIEERRRSEGKVIHGKKGTRKKGEGNRKPRGRTKTRRTEWGVGGKGH